MVYLYKVIMVIIGLMIILVHVMHAGIVIDTFTTDNANVLIFTYISL